MIHILNGFCSFLQCNFSFDKPCWIQPSCGNQRQQIWQVLCGKTMRSNQFQFFISDKTHGNVGLYMARETDLHHSTGWTCTVYGILNGLWKACSIYRQVGTTICNLDDLRSDLLVGLVWFEARTTCVAPRVRAFSNAFSDTSTATTCKAPCAAASMTHDSPNPPHPKIATISSARSLPCCSMAR